MKSASKIRNTYIELKRIFGDEYSEEHLHSLSIKIINLFENLKRPQKTKKRNFIIPDNNQSRYISHRPLYEVMTNKQNSMKYQFEGALSDDVDTNMNKTIISQWFMENAQ